MRDALDTTLDITNWIKNSPKRDSKLNEIKSEAKAISDEYFGEVETITLLCPTRWTVCAKSLNSLMTNYTYLIELWE